MSTASQKTESAALGRDSIRRQFASRHAAAQPQRVAALARFEATGFPSRRHEDWRYTDLKPLSEGHFDLAPPAPDAETLVRVADLLDNVGLCGPDSPRVVLVDGHVATSLSRTAAAPGIEFTPLADSAPDGDPGGSTHPLAELNAAFASHGAGLRIARGVESEAPVEIVFVATGRAGSAPQPVVRVELAQNASATVVQHFVDLESAEAGWTNAVTDIVLGPGSKLRLYRLQEHGPFQHQTSLLRGRVGRDAQLEVGYADLGGRLVRNDIDVLLDEPGGSVDLFGLALSSADQHKDNHVRIDHAAPSTASRESFRAIAGDNGRGVFNGKIVVRAGAQKIDAEQSSNNLLLSDKAEIDTKPELEIYADDVKCSHGATIGELDPDHLFYLRSRGLSELEARGLLTFAFANVTIGRFPLAALRTRAALKVAGQLPEDVEWESLT